MSDAPLLDGALADEALADLEPLADSRPARVGVARERARRCGVALGHRAGRCTPWCALTSGTSSESSMLADRDEIALALQHAGEAGEVGLQPVLLGVAVGREPQVVDHRVDVVLELGHLAARVDLDRARQVALGHRRRHLGDGAHLGRQVRGEQVHVAGQVLPGAGRAGHVGLAAEAAFDADLARDRRHLVGEGRERAGHVVDRLGERRDLALRLARSGSA